MTQHRHDTAANGEAGGPDFGKRMSRLQRAAILASIVLAMLVGAMDTTILNTTMPRIAGVLGGHEWYAWTFASYMIFSTVLAPVAGRLADLFGRKRVFAVGLLIFLGGSALCGWAGSMLQLVIFRAIQGIGAGLVLPFPAIIAGDLFTIEKRGQIQALFNAMWGIAGLIAPFLGGLFLETAGWRWIFWVNIPVCLISLLFLMAYREAYRPKPSRVDGVGAVLFAAGIVLVLLVTVEVPYRAFLAAAGLGLLALFFLYERRHPSPIIPMSLLQNRPIRWISLNAFLTYAALFGASSFVPMFLQHQGYSVFVSGAVLLGMTAGWMLFSVPAGKWILKYGYPRLIVAGSSILAAGGVLLTLLREGTGPLPVAAVMFVLGLAFGLISTVGIICSQMLVGPHEKGVSTSLQLLCRNIGTAIGVTVMGALFNGASGPYEGFSRLFGYGAAVGVITLLFALPLLRKAARGKPAQAEAER
ncbi:MAG TPA: MFS transporter [Paenibacillaceae bacterium]